MEDVLFWFLTGIFLIFVIFKFNNGELRSYIFVGLGLGITIYLLIFSKLFINVNTTIIKFLKMIIRKIILILLYPLKILKNIFNKLVLSNVKKLNNIIIFYVKKCKKDKKLQKNKEEKKDFEETCRK